MSGKPGDRIQSDHFIDTTTTAPDGPTGSLLVRAVVTVKSAGTAIAPADAELYLKCAVEEGSVANVTSCLHQGVGVNCQFRDDLYTPLHTACSTSRPRSIAVLELLLANDADGNAVNKWKETPLLIAANNGNVGAVKALLKNKADPSKCSEAGWSALTFACHKGYAEIVEILLGEDASVDTR